MTYFFPEVIATPKSVVLLITEVTKVGGDVYRTKLGNVFEFDPTRVFRTKEDAEAAGRRDMFLMSLKIKEYLQK